MQYRFIEQVDTKEHGAFVSKHKLCNLLQSSGWGLVKENWKHIVTGIKYQNQLVASCMVFVRPLPLEFNMFYIPHGPILDFPNTALVALLMKELKHCARKYRCLFITFNPAVHYNDYTIKEINESHYEYIDTIIQMLQDQRAVFKEFTKYIGDTIQPRYHTDIYACDDFNATLSKGCRKALQAVQKKTIEVLSCHMDGVEDFAGVMYYMEKRKNIHLRDQEYLQHLVEIYGKGAVIFLVKLPLRKLYGDTKQRHEQNERDLARCPKSTKKKRFTLEKFHASLNCEIKELQENLERDESIAIASGALCVKFGLTVEILYAGMDERYKRYMAPYAGFYNCMTQSFGKGYRWSSMGGIEGSLEGGLTKFKANHNPTINGLIGGFDLPVYKSLYALSQWVMKQRKEALQKKQEVRTVKQVPVCSLEEIGELGLRLTSLIKPGMLITLSGDLGAGKTAFIKYLGNGLSVKKTINSSIFTILRIYQGASMPVYHIDTYRLEGITQNFGFEEYFEDDDVYVIEWPHFIESQLPGRRLHIDTTRVEGGDEKRMFTFDPRGEVYEKIMEAL